MSRVLFTQHPPWCAKYIFAAKAHSFYWPYSARPKSCLSQSVQHRVFPQPVKSCAFTKPALSSFSAGWSANTVLNRDFIRGSSEHFRFTCWHLKSMQGGVFLREKPLSFLVPVSIYIENAVASGLRPALELTCRRCNDTLREQDRYCASCGLPQLLYVAAEGMVMSVSGGGSEEAALPSGLTARGLGSSSGIAWRAALRAVLVAAIPASLLCSAFPGSGILCMAAAAAWAVNLYARRLHATTISTGAGARIGLVTGLTAIWMTLGLNGAYVWFHRFVLHGGAQMEADWTSFVDQSMQMNQEIYSRLGVNSAQLTQELQLQRLSMLSAEGRAGFPLLFFFFSALFLVLFSLISGAISARFLTSSNRKRA